MECSKFQIMLLVLQFFLTICVGRIMIGTPRSEEETSKLIEATVNVLKSCYGTWTNEVYLAGTFPNSLPTSLSSEPYLSFNIEKMNDTSELSKQYKQQLFLITTSSLTDLKSILVNIEKSYRWNHLAYFNIMNWPPTKDGCSMAYEFLLTAWNMDLLETKFFCINEKEEVSIYSFNPYTSTAPDPWKVEKIYQDGPFDHPWTLFVQKYLKMNQLCKNINFDKTKNIGGYKIRIIKLKNNRVNLKRSKIEQMVTGSRYHALGLIMTSIFHSFNATAFLQVHENPYLFRDYTEQEKRIQEIISKIIAGKSDLLMVLQWNNPIHHRIATTTSFVKFYEVFVLTQFNGYESQLGKIVSLIDQRSRIGVLLVLIITVIIFKYLLKQTIAFAILNAFRLFCGSCLPKPPSHTSSRLYLAGLLYFLVTILGIYQSELAALLAKRIPRPNIDSIDDLAKSDHKIYSFIDLRKDLTDPVFSRRTYVSYDFSCANDVLMDKSVACLDICENLIDNAAHHNLYLSKQAIIGTKIQSSFLIRKNWPLEPRINKLIESLVEAHIFEYMYKNATYRLSKAIDIRERKDKDVVRKIFAIDDLLFAFVILGIGLGLGLLCFSFEMILARRQIPQIQISYRKIHKSILRFRRKLISPNPI